MHHRLKHILSGLLISFSTLCLMGAIGEAALRVDFARRNPPLYPAPTGIRLNPNSQGTVDGTWVTINAHGMRDNRDYSMPKPDGVIRIAFIGDSVTFGTGVELQDTFVKVLERRLNSDSQTTYEVLNFGVPGTNTPHHIAMIDQAEKLDPDIIILAYFLNDAAPTSESYLSGDADSWVARLLRWSKTQARRSFLVQMIIEKTNIAASLWHTIQESQRKPLDEIVTQTPTPPQTILSPSAPAPQEPTQLDSFVLDALSWYVDEPGSVWQVNRSYLDTFVSKVKRTGAQFVMVIFPLEQQVDETGASRHPQTLLLDFCSDSGIACIDLAPALEQAAADHPGSLFLDGAHLNPEGHAVAATAIYRGLIDLGLLTP